MAVWASRLKLDCRKCAEAEKKENGCDEPTLVPTWTIRAHDMSFDRCPLRLITQDTIEFLRAYGWMKKGFLPSGRAWLDESSKLIAAFEIISREVELMENEATKK